jgi:hypothetical protein
MAFPVVIQGGEGEQYNDYAATDQRWQLGQKMVMNDGRAYRFHKVGASTLVVADVVDGPANITNHLSQAPTTASSVGSANIVVTLGATASAKNQYRGGYVNATQTPGLGELYVLNSDPNLDTHAAVASSGVITALLSDGETIRTALTASSLVDMILNPYSGTIQSPVTTLISEMIGIAVKASTTGRFGWIQTRGIASVKVSGTAVVGNNIVRLVAAAGAAGPAAADTTVLVGVCNSVGVTMTTVDLRIDG